MAKRIALIVLLAVFIFSGLSMVAFAADEVEWVEKQSIRVVYDNELQGQDVWRQTNAVNKKSLLTFLKGLIDEV